MTSLFPTTLPDPRTPGFVLGYWRPWDANSDILTSYLDYTRDASLAKYAANVVGQYILQAGKEHVRAINQLSNRLSSQLSSIDSKLSRLNRNMELVLEQQRLSNVLLENVAELLRVPDSEKERQHTIEMGIKFFVNAVRDPDLYLDALEMLLKAESMMKQDYFVLHRIGCIYLHVEKCLDPAKALDYFSRAAKYASVESDPKAVRLANILIVGRGRVNSAIAESTDAIRSLAAEAYEEAAFAAYVIGKDEQAVGHQSRCLELNPTPRVRLTLSKYQMRAGQKAESLQSLDQSIGDAPLKLATVFREIDLINEPDVLKIIEKHGDTYRSVCNLLAHRDEIVRQLLEDLRSRLNKLRERDGFYGSINASTTTQEVLRSSGAHSLTPAMPPVVLKKDSTSSIGRLFGREQSVSLGVPGIDFLPNDQPGLSLAVLGLVNGQKVRFFSREDVSLFKNQCIEMDRLSCELSEFLNKYCQMKTNRLESSVEFVEYILCALYGYAQTQLAEISPRTGQWRTCGRWGVFGFEEAAEFYSYLAQIQASPEKHKVFAARNQKMIGRRDPRWSADLERGEAQVAYQEFNRALRSLPAGQFFLDVELACDQVTEEIYYVQEGFAWKAEHGLFGQRERSFIKLWSKSAEQAQQLDEALESKARARHFLLFVDALTLLAAVDGRLDSVEITAISGILAKFGMSTDSELLRVSVEQSVAEIRATGVTAFANTVRNRLIPLRNAKVCDDLLNAMACLADLDGAVHKNEARLIDWFKKQLGKGAS